MLKAILQLCSRLISANMADIGGNLLRSWTKDVRLLSWSSGNSLEPERGRLDAVEELMQRKWTKKWPWHWWIRGEETDIHVGGDWIVGSSPWKTWERFQRHGFRGHQDDTPGLRQLMGEGIQQPCLIFVTNSASTSGQLEQKADLQSRHLRDVSYTMVNERMLWFFMNQKTSPTSSHNKKIWVKDLCRNWFCSDEIDFKIWSEKAPLTKLILFLHTTDETDFTSAADFACDTLTKLNALFLLPYTALHCLTLPTLPYTALHSPTLPYIALHCPTLRP